MMRLRRSHIFPAVVLLLALSIGVATAATMKTAGGKILPVTPEIGRLLQNGAKAWRSGRYEQAISQLTAALKLQPGNQVAAVIYDERAGARLHREDAAGALSDATEAIRLNPALATAYSKRGLVYRRQRNWDKAIAEFNVALRLDPNLYDAWNNRGLIYSDMGRSEAAMRDFNEAIRRNPNYANAYHNRAVEYSNLGKNEKAIADYDEAIRRDPKVQNSHINRAVLLKQMGQGQKAAAEYDRVSRKSPQHTVDWVGRGDAFVAKGEYKKAASDYRRALQLSPTHRDALNALAWLEATCPDASVRDGKDALEKSRRVCELTKWREADYVDTLAAACAEVGDFAQAVRYQTQAIEMRGLRADQRKGAQKRLALYRSGKPYRREP